MCTGWNTCMNTPFSQEALLREIGSARVTLMGMTLPCTLSKTSGLLSEGGMMIERGCSSLCLGRRSLQSKDTPFGRSRPGEPDLRNSLEDEHEISNRTYILCHRCSGRHGFTFLLRRRVREI